MTPVDQEFTLERGELGDCWRACIASILDLPREAVPHFMRIAHEQVLGPMTHVDQLKPGGPEVPWFSMTDEWLRERGMRINILMDPTSHDGYAIGGGLTTAGIGHAVIVVLPAKQVSRNEMQVQIAHDPSGKDREFTEWWDFVTIVPLEGWEEHVEMVAMEPDHWRIEHPDGRVSAWSREGSKPEGPGPNGPGSREPGPQDAPESLPFPVRNTPDVESAAALLGTIRELGGDY